MTATTRATRRAPAFGASSAGERAEPRDRPHRLPRSCRNASRCHRPCHTTRQARASLARYWARAPGHRENLIGNPLRKRVGALSDRSIDGGESIADRQFVVRPGIASLLPAVDRRQQMGNRLCLGFDIEYGQWRQRRFRDLAAIGLDVRCRHFPLLANDSEYQIFELQRDHFGQRIA